jgi:transposase InsO family protein
MSDNAKCYATSHTFRDTLAELDARHILIPPYTPRWNGKIERFFGTLDSEWAHGASLAELDHARPRPVIVSALLQPTATALGRRRPTTHHPRPASPRAGRLGRAADGEASEGQKSRSAISSRLPAGSLR